MERHHRRDAGVAAQGHRDGDEGPQHPLVRERGCTRIRTFNEANNRNMLGINERLDSVKLPAWISFENVLKEDA